MTDEPVVYTDPWAEANATYMRSKLAAAGATVEESDEFMEQWLHDPDWDHLDKERLIALGDAKLRAELAISRADGLLDTETEAEEDERVAAEENRQADAAEYAEAERVSGWDPIDIMQWVGRDVQRARNILSIEEEHPQSRAGLIAAMLRVLDDAQRT